MADTTNLSLMTPTPSLTAAMIGASDPRNDESTDLFEIQENHLMAQQHSNDTQPDYNMSPTSALDFDPESYLTPRRSVINCDLSLNPPSLLRRINHCDRNESKRMVKEAHNTLHQTTSIIIPSIGSKEDIKASSPLSPGISLFKLIPRAERVCDSPPRLRLKSTLQDTPDFFSHHQNRNTTESKMESNKL